MKRRNTSEWKNTRNRDRADGLEKLKNTGRRERLIGESRLMRTTGKQ